MARGGVGAGSEADREQRGTVGDSELEDLVDGQCRVLQHDGAHVLGLPGSSGRAGAAVAAASTAAAAGTCVRAVRRDLEEHDWLPFPVSWQARGLGQVGEAKDLHEQ
jgi:hypothetical protein